MPDTPTLPTSADVRQRLGDAATKLADLRNRPADQRGDTYAADLKAASTEIYDLNGLLDAAARIEQYDLQALAFQAAMDAAANGPEPRGPQAAGQDFRGAHGEYRTPARELVESEAYTEFAQRAANGAGSRMPEMKLERSLLSPEVRTLLDFAGADNAAFLVPNGQPIPPKPRQMRFWLRDVLSVQGTSLASIPYVRELNPATNETGATGVAEGGLKPEVTMEFEEDNAVVKKIAAWIPATMEILADAPTLLGYINTRLVYMLKVRETYQILSGAGTGAQLKGITSYANIQTQAAVAGDVPATIAAAIGKVENVDLEANGIAMNPLDFWESAATRHTDQFDSEAQGNAPVGAPEPYIWGMPTIRTRALASSGGAATGKAVVADWAMGATLFDRMQATIRQSDSHDDWFVYNKVAILAEERIALAVHREDAFVHVTIDTAA